ncbi:formimidoylglutamate deiminase [Luteimonas sp. RIT-PG2_3]
MAEQNITSGQRFWAGAALLPGGWATGVAIDIDRGRIVGVQPDVEAVPGDQRLQCVVPGLGNLHSHAFQRGMAGLAEIGGGDGDSFWSWRNLMYRFLERLQPEDVHAIAAQAYAEMLEAGFTRVGEFHYLHHDPDGQRYADPAEMAARIAAAADETGIGMTLLPVFYAHSGFGGQPPTPAQRRLIHDIDGFERLLQGCRVALSGIDDAVLGVAPHSLRAVTAAQLAQLPALVDGPVHIHIAEQVAEVEASLAWSGQRPVQWLYANMPVDARWCLVHATHLDDAELEAIVDSDAVVGLCPITEANLGDGLFPLRAFSDAGGRFGVGSDSNVYIDAAEELRLLEYGQRLTHQRRNVLVGDARRSTGRHLFEAALQGGAQALGVATGLKVGAPADLVELDPSHPALVARHGDAILDSWLFAARNGAVKSVWRQGRRLVAEGRHVARERIQARYQQALSALLRG